MRKLILHLGMDKTGTSAIQRFLHINRNAFLKHADLLYPKAGIWNDFSHHQLVFSFIEQHGYRKENFIRLVKKLDSEISKASNVVISSECLFKTPSHPNFSIFKNQILTLFDHVTAIIYIRRQDLWLESRYKHSVKSGQEIPLQNLATPLFCDYLQFIEKWALVLGRENIVVRPYEKEQFQGNSIFTDFLWALGVNDRADFIRPLSRVNDSLCNRGTAFKKLFNPLLTQSHLGHRLNQLLLAYARDSILSQSTSSLLSEEERIGIIERYKPINARIARKFRPTGPKFLFLNNQPKRNLSLFKEISPDEITQIWDFIRCSDLLFYDSLLAIAEREADRDDSIIADNARTLLVPFMDSVVLDQQKIPQLHPKKMLSRLLFSRKKASSLLSWICSPLLKPKNVVCPCDAPSSTSKGRLFLHIGIPKTGTSAIQSFLAGQTALLEQDDCCYPRAGRGFVFTMQDGKIQTDAHHQLALALLAKSGPNGQPQYKGPTFKELLSAVIAECQNRTNVVISSEVFYNTKILPFVHAFKQTGKDIRIIVYFRAQDQLLESAYAQRVKKNSCTEDLQSFINRELETNRSLEYDLFLSELASVIGVENIVVRIYDRKQFPNQNVILDFLHILGVGRDVLDKARSVTGESNPSLSNAAVLFKRELNKLALSKRQDEAVVAALQDYSSSDSSRNRPRYSLINPAQQTEIRKFFATSNKHFAQRYAPGIDRAWAAENQNNSLQYYAVLQTRDIAAIINHLKVTCPQLLTILFIQYIITYRDISGMDTANASIFQTMQTIQPQLEMRLVHDFVWSNPVTPRPHDALTWLRFTRSSQEPLDASTPCEHMQTFHVQTQGDTSCIELYIPADKNNSVLIIRLATAVREQSPLRLFYQSFSDPLYSGRQCISRTPAPGNQDIIFFIDDPSCNGHIRVVMHKSINLDSTQMITILQIKLS